MNRLTVLFSLLLLTVQVQAQSFEGEIIYSNHFTSKMKNFTDEQLNTMMGTSKSILSKVAITNLF